MALTKYKLGALIELCDVRNYDGIYTLDDIRGISTGKEFIETKANMDGVSLSSYKVVDCQEFVYVADTSRRGDKIAIAFNTVEKPVLISSIYTVFRVVDKDKLLSDYLFMFFNRPEFDRYARFNSWGSARETFDWDTMCDIDIELPDLPTQQKYVDIYNAMVANQQSYERGLGDLKLTFDALIDNIKHNASMVPVRDLLAEVDNRNGTGEIVDVQGINIFKQFMPSVADTNGVDLSKYKIVRKGQFAYSGMQTGRDECIRIALFDKDEPVIISPAYTVFEIKDGTVLPEYIMMWFSRKESDRRGWFMSDSSIRTNLDLERFYEIGIPLPDEKMQKSIVDLYKVYTLRRSINEQLKAQIKDNSVAPTADDVEQATGVFREELVILKDLFAGYDLTPFLDPNGDPALRYRLLAKAAEYVFISTQELQTESKGGKSVKKVSFKTYFLKTVKRMRAAYDICQPSGELGEEESALAQCFMAIAGFVRKMSGTSEVDADTMNRHVAKMVEEALRYNEVESVLENGEQEDIFSAEYFEKLSDVKMPASKLELLVKMLRKQISEYSKTNQMAAKKFQEMLEETIKQYHERRKHLTAEEAGEAQEHTTEEIIKNATEQALQILRDMNADRESFRKIGLTFEEKAFYDILMALRDEYNFEYGEDKVVDGITVNDKCKALAKKVKEIIDTKSSFADWLNNQIVRDQLKFDIKVCLIKNGYPPQYSPEVFRKVMEQVENFEENN